MRNFFLIAFLFIATECFSQPHIKPSERNSRQKPLQNDSVLTRLRQFDDSIAKDIRKKEELKHIEQDAQRSTDYFVRLQKERRAKEKKNALIRIGIGIVFLIVLIFGLRRRIKKQ